MPERHLKQPEFTYGACGPLTKRKKEFKKFKETGDSRYIYKNELGKASFQHNMDYEDFRNLAKVTASDKVLLHKAFNVANPKYDEYQTGLATMVYKIFDEKSTCRGTKNESKQN